MRAGQTKSAAKQLSTFEDILKDVQASNWKTALQRCSKDYQLKSYKVVWLSPSKIREIYAEVVRRYYTDNATVGEGWFENELRVFVWILMSWSQILDLHPDKLNPEHWESLSQILNNKPVDLLQFQLQNLKKTCVRGGKWSVQEDQILKETLSNWTQKKISWNQISKEIYYSTSKRMFRSPKQCRQRWNNYLDPLKTRGQWTQDEDKSLINIAIRLGKRWALIGKQLGNVRTEHMIKNRFNSLIGKFRKENTQLKHLNDQKVLSLINAQFSQQGKTPRAETQKPNQKKQEQMPDTAVVPQSQKQTQTEKPHFVLPTMMSFPTPLLRKNTSKMNDQIVGSPTMAISPGFHLNFMMPMTPSLISPFAGRNKFYGYDVANVGTTNRLITTNSGTNVSTINDLDSVQIIQVNYNVQSQKGSQGELQEQGQRQVISHHQRRPLEDQRSLQLHLEVPSNFRVAIRTQRQTVLDGRVPRVIEQSPKGDPTFQLDGDPRVQKNIQASGTLYSHPVGIYGWNRRLRGDKIQYVFEVPKPGEQLRGGQEQGLEGCHYFQKLHLHQVK